MTRMDMRFIDRPQDVSETVRDLAAAPWLALDTEFMRGNTYSARLCLVQVASADLIAVFDACALGEQMSPLTDLLFSDRTRKVLHSAYQDLEVFYDLRGSVPAPVYDTQIGALLLGFEPQMGYGAMVEAVTGTTLPKAHTREDWARRPLDPAAVAYAADDVKYLRQVYEAQQEELDRLGRGGWLADDFARMGEPRLYANPPEEAWKRIRGAERLVPVQLSVLRALAAWRERKAREWDRPRKWILQDGPLLEMSRRLPKTLAELGEIRDLERRQIEKRGAEWIRLIEAAAAEADDERPQLEAHQRMTRAEAKKVDELAKVVDAVARPERVHPTLVATKKELARLVLQEHDIPLLRGWRRDLVGEKLLEHLRP